MTLPSWLETLRHPHRNQRIVARAATPLGQAAIWVLAVVLLAPRDLSLAITIGAVLGPALVFPAARNLMMSIGAGLTLGLFVAGQQRQFGASGQAETLVTTGGVVLVTLLLYATVRAARAFDRLPGTVRRWPQVSLHALLWAALGAAWLLPPQPDDLASALFRVTVACLPFFVWRCGYLLLAGKRGSAAGTSLPDHFLYLSPVYGGSPVPYGKGYDYLTEADAPVRARAQVAGLKLFALAWIWTGARLVMDAVVYSGGPFSLGLRRLASLISEGPDASLGAIWLSLMMELVYRTLNLAIAGHFIIGALRLFGFGVFRNTYKPLLSESLVDFWNRFYYYFKELLVEFFFFPTYVAYFKRHPRARLFAATMMAACVGNLYYHVLVYLPALAAAGAEGAAALMSSRVCYSVLLGLGIFISLLRQQRLRGQPAASADGVPALVRLRRIAGVWLFYGLIHIWNVEPIDLTFAQRTRFFLSLFGLG